MKFYFKLLLVIIFSIVTFIIFPTYGHILWKGKINKNIEKYNSTSELIKNIFKTDEKDIYPKYNPKLDTEKLKELGKKLNIDFNNIIKKVNQSYGSYWIDTALQISITNLIKDMESNIYEINYSMKFYNFISALIGLIILLIFYKIQNFQPSNKKFVSYLFSFILSIGILIFFYFNLKTLLLINITKPLQILFSTKNITSIFHFGTIVILLQIAFLIFLILKALYLKSDKFAFFWFIPAVIILINVFTQPDNMLHSYKLYHNVNKKYVKNMTKNRMTEILSEIRQKNMQKDSLAFLKKFQSSQFADFTITKNDTLVEIVAKTKINIDDNELNDKILYYIKKDSVKMKE